LPKRKNTSEQGINYDEWIDSVQKPMRWNSSETYTEGDIITIKTFLRSHHTCHMEVRAFPKGRDSTQKCFDDNVLEFVKDVAYGMPKGMSSVYFLLLIANVAVVVEVVKPINLNHISR